MHIQNPAIFRILEWMFRTLDMFWTLPWHILAYSTHCVMLACWEPCPIQNFTIFRIWAYSALRAFSESCLYWHIQTYSIMTVAMILSFFLFTLILHTYFSTIFKDMSFDYNDVNFNARLSWLPLNVIFENSVIIE